MTRFEFIDEAPAEQKSGNRFSFVDENPSVAKDVLEQAGAKGLAGATGSYGNLLEALGMQLKSGEMLPGQKARTNLSFQLLERLNNGEALSPHELDFLVEEDILPFFSRLPTSKEVSQQIEQATGIGEGKTSLGRITGRSAEFLGETAALGAGGKALKTAAAAGAAGQSVREVGAPEPLAAGTELIASLAPSGISKKLVPASKKAQKTVEAGRRLGLSEEQITPLIQSEKKVAALSSVAKKGERTKKLFGSIKEKLGDAYSSLKNASQSKKVLKPDQRNALNEGFVKIEADLSKTLSPSPEKKGAIEYVQKSIENLHSQDITPEHLINFWQDINKSVKWNSIDGGKKSLTALKEPILEALKKTAPQIAEDFELVNELYGKYAKIAKKLKPEIVDSFLNKAEVMALAPAALGLVSGNTSILVGLAGESALRVLAREMLINPYFQNVANKLVQNFNQASLMGLRHSLEDTKKYLEKKYPKENWEFLKED